MGSINNETCGITTLYYIYKVLLAQIKLSFCCAIKSIKTSSIKHFPVSHRIWRWTKILQSLFQTNINHMACYPYVGVKSIILSFMWEEERWIYILYQNLAEWLKMLELRIITFLLLLILILVTIMCLSFHLIHQLHTILIHGSGEHIWILYSSKPTR